MSRIWKISMVAMTLALAACDSPADVPGSQPGPGRPGQPADTVRHPAVGTVAIGGYSMPLVAGDTARLTVKAWSPSGEELTVPVSWSSADSSLAVITADGLLAARSAGLARVDVQVGSYRTYAQVQIRNRAAVLEELSPREAMAGSEPLMITIRGRHFAAGAQAIWWRTPLPTVRVSDTELRAEVPASHLAQWGGAPITVLNPESVGASSSISFVVNRWPVVKKTYRLAGTQSGDGLPVQVRRGSWQDWQTGVRYDDVITTITAGRLELEERQAEDTYFIHYTTETLTDAATGQVVKTNELVWFGWISYDALDGALIFNSGGLPFTVRGRRLDDGSIVMEQNVAGRIVPWVFMK
jgi:hypothetical protein